MKNEFQIMCKAKKFCSLDNWKSLREPAEHDRPKVETFLKIANFDTDLQACLDDPKKALSYQTGKDCLFCRPWSKIKVSK